MPRNVPYPLVAQGLPVAATVPVGYFVRYPFTITDSLGTVQTSLFASDDVMDATLWPGDDRAETFDPAIAWVSATAGTAALSIAAADTTALTPGTYRLQVWTVVDSQKCLIHDGTVRFTAAPGAATALTTYCTYQDMQRLFASIGDLQSNEDQAGFAEQRNMARKWFDTVIQRHYRNDDGRPTDTQFANYDFGSGRSGARSTYLQDYLDDDGLILNQDVIDCVACYAISLVLSAQVGTDPNNFYQSLGAKFSARASSMASLITAEVDTDDDGEPDIAVDLGCFDVLRG